MSVDVAECLRRGAVGAVGAIPGTLAAHPMDVVKMNLQVTGSIDAIRSGGIGRLYSGVGAGVQQKVATRGPMFLASEFATQQVMRLGVDRQYALFVGSAMSGYATGFFAAGFEWSKVQGGVVGTSASSAPAAASRRLVVRHGAGLRNGIFDATFFGCEHAAKQYGVPPAVSYGAAAALAVALDFPLDAAVKQSMAAPPHEPATFGPLTATVRLLRARGLGAFAGLSAKACEFAISYAVTGACSTHVKNWLLF